MSTNFVSLLVLASGWMGMAFQSLATVLVFTWLVWWLRQGVSNQDLAAETLRNPAIRMASMLGIGWLIWGYLVSAINPATSSVPPAFVGEFLWWALAPWSTAVFVEAWNRQGRGAREKWVSQFGYLICWGALIVCLIAATQYIWGWKIQGSSIIASEQRARGLFSHPLSLAYIVLLYIPLGLAFWARDHQNRYATVGLLACAFLVATSSSRTVQAVVALVVCAWCLFALRGRVRVVAIVAGCVIAALLALTDNPVRSRFVATVEMKEDRQQERYADDRVAFWAVHADMFHEKPFTGHGLTYRQDYLDRYYVAHGLGELKKKYPAHNMYLQVLVNTGIPGLLLWLARIAVDLMACVTLIKGMGGTRLRSPRAWIGWTGIATIVAMMLAGLTQNAFQDSAVRYHWAILEGLLLWFTGRQEVQDGQLQEAIPA